MRKSPFATACIPATTCLLLAVACQQAPADAPKPAAVVQAPPAPPAAAAPVEPPSVAEVPAPAATPLVGKWGRVTGDVQVRQGQQGAWQPLSPNSEVVCGQSFATSGNSRARLVVDGQRQVIVQANTHVQFVADAADANACRMMLESGHVRIRLTRAAAAAEPLQLPFQIAQMPAVGYASLRSAVIDLRMQGARGQVLTQLGRVALQDGTQVLPGEAVDIEAGERVHGPYDGFSSSTTSLPHRHAVVHYLAWPPALRFAAEDHAPKQRLQIARDRKFKQIEIDEVVPHHSYATDLLPQGNYYWRLGTSGKASRLQIVPEPRRCSNCLQQTHLDDSGKPVTLGYQSRIPVVHLHWSTLPKAHAYDVALYAQTGKSVAAGAEEVASPRANVDAPALWRKTVFASETTLPAKLLRDGQFAWQVTPVDAQGAAMVRTRRNALRVVHLGSVQRLRIDAPPPSGTQSLGRVTTRGELPVGAQLFINDAPIAVGRTGRFQAVVPLQPGANKIRYRVVAPHVPDRFYQRYIYRLAPD